MYGFLDKTSHGAPQALIFPFPSLPRFALGYANTTWASALERGSVISAMMFSQWLEHCKVEIWAIYFFPSTLKPLGLLTCLMLTEWFCFFIILQMNTYNTYSHWVYNGKIFWAQLQQATCMCRLGISSSQ